MKLHLGKPIITPDCPTDADASWHRVRASGLWQLQLQAVLMAALLVWLLGLFWYYFTCAPFSLEFPGHVPLSTILLAFVVILPLHELLHALASPGFGFGERSYFGCWPSRMVLYAHYTGIMSRRRRIVMVLTPFVVLSVLPLVAAMALSEQPTAYFHWFHVRTPFLAICSIVNVLGSSGDCVMAFDHWRNIPKGALLHCGGESLFWRMPA